MTVASALALGGFGLPVFAIGGTSHNPYLEEPTSTAKLSGFASGSVGDSHWVVHTDAGRPIGGHGEFFTHSDSFEDAVQGEQGGNVDYSNEHRRYGGSWPGRGGIGSVSFDDGHIDEDHFCGGQCVQNPGVVPEPALPALMFAGLSGVLFLVRRRRRRAG
jgi:hypothetical protein